ncbi:MAG: proteasome accessory factor PafA2 family protein, partial [Deltaproteobacteria bacterium]|nr:proteasome accessory factor PafA2 family protein [Deltaproteobacteria bacterium]
GIRDLVAHEKAGDRIVQELVEHASAQMANNGLPGELIVFKNNVDHFGTTYGSHENYLVTPRAMDRIHLIVPFLVTRQIFAGAGKMVTGKRAAGSPYRLTQRADFIDRVFSDRTSRIRGIINLRKREVPRQGQNRRLHILVGDSNMSESAIGLKNGTTGLVLRLLEEDGLNNLPLLAAPVDAIKAISRRLDRPLPLEGRKASLSALDIQTIYLERVLAFYSSRENDPYDREIIELWTRALKGLKDLKVAWTTGVLEDDPGDLKRKLDWLLKLWLISRIRDKTGIQSHDWRLKLLDVGYHDLSPSGSLFERCVALNEADRMIEEAEIRKAQTDPPSNTRAWTRGMIIQCATGKGVEVLVDNWEKVTIIAKPQGRSVVHPFDRQRRMINRLKIQLENPLMSQDASVLQQVESFVQTWGGQRAIPIGEQ